MVASSLRFVAAEKPGNRNERGFPEPIQGTPYNDHSRTAAYLRVRTVIMPKTELDPGRLICEGVTVEVQPWMYYVIAVAGALLGTPFLLASVPLIWSTRKGDFEGGVAGTLISLIFIGAGALAIRAARSKSTVFSVRFFENCVDIGAAGTGARRIAYGDLDQIAVVLRVPSIETNVSAVAKGVISLVSGNAIGIGAAFAKSQSGGVVILKSSSNETLIIPRISLDHARRIAEIASRERGEDVLTYDS